MSWRPKSDPIPVQTSCVTFAPHIQGLIEEQGPRQPTPTCAAADVSASVGERVKGPTCHRAVIRDVMRKRGATTYGRDIVVEKMDREAMQNWVHRSATPEATNVSRQDMEAFEARLATKREEIKSLIELEERVNLAKNEGLQTAEAVKIKMQGKVERVKNENRVLRQEADKVADLQRELDKKSMKVATQREKLSRLEEDMKAMRVRKEGAGGSVSTQRTQRKREREAEEARDSVSAQRTQRNREREAEDSVSTKRDSEREAWIKRARAIVTV